MKRIVIGILFSMIMISSLSMKSVLAAEESSEKIVIESLEDNSLEEINLEEESEAEKADTGGEEEKDVIQAIQIDGDHFPDEVFQAYVLKEFDKDKDNFLSVEEMNAVEEMVIQSREDIKDLTGLQYFPHLKSIFTSDSIEKLDVSSNLELLSLRIVSAKNLETLDLSSNKKLQELSISGRRMTKIDLSANHSLKDVSLRGYFGYFDEEKLWKMEVIWPEENNIEKMILWDIIFKEETFTVFPKLRELNYDWTGIDLSAFPNLEKLDLSENALSDKYQKTIFPKPLDVSQNPKLRELTAWEEIPACEVLDFSHNPELEKVGIGVDLMKDTWNTDWSPEGCEIVLNSDKLTDLNIVGVPVSKINLSGCPNLTRLNLTGLIRPEGCRMPLSELDLYSVLKLKYLLINNSHLKDIDISENKNLESFRITAELPYFYKLDNRDFTRYSVTLRQDISLNKNHYYDLAKISGYEKGCIKAVKGGTLKGSKLYPTAREVKCEFYMDDAKKYVGTYMFSVSGQLAPSPVQGLALKGRTSGSLTFRWKSAADADGYRVYAKNMETGEIEQRKSISKSKNSYTFKNLKAGGKYTVIVRAYKGYKESYKASSDKKNYYSTYGDSGNTKNYYVLPANTILKSKSLGNAKVQLSWNGQETNYRSGDSGYLLYYNTSSKGPFTRLAKVSDSTNAYVTGKLKRGKTYYFKMRGYIRNAGSSNTPAFSSYSKVVKATVK